MALPAPSTMVFDTPGDPAARGSLQLVRVAGSRLLRNDWLSTPDLAARDEQLDRFVEHIVIQAIVSEKGTEAQKDAFGRMEETSLEFVYLESHAVRDSAEGRRLDDRSYT